MTKHFRIRILLALAALLGASLAVVAAPSATADGEPQVTVDDITVYEPHFGESASLDFTVTLDSATTSPLTVPWQYYKGKYYGSASPFSHGDLVFEAGETVKTLSFPLAFDPNDDVKPYYRTVELVPNWRNVDQFGVATIIDTTRNGTFDCDSVAYESREYGYPTGVPVGTFSGAVYGPDCHAGFLEEKKASYDAQHVTVADSTMQVVQYADNSVRTQPAAGDGGETHVQMQGLVWRVEPGLVLRMASLKADATIVCTAVGALPQMEASSSVTGLRINGAPALGTITDERAITYGNTRIILNSHTDQSVTIAGGPQQGEPDRSVRQVAIEVLIDGGGLQYESTDLGTVWVHQGTGNPCAS